MYEVESEILHFHFCDSHRISLRGSTKVEVALPSADSFPQSPTVSPYENPTKLLRRTCGAENAETENSWGNCDLAEIWQRVKIVARSGLEVGFLLKDPQSVNR